MPVCIDPSHSVGSRDSLAGGHTGCIHVTPRGTSPGPTLDTRRSHPVPSKALVDGPQALHMDELDYLLEDVRLAREAYEKRVALASKHRNPQEALAA